MLTTDKQPAPAGEAVEPPGRGQSRTRRLVAAAIALLAIPSAIGFIMLRSDTVPTISGQGGQLVVNRPIEGSEDLLQPAAAGRTGPSRILYKGTDGEPIGVPNGGTIPLGNDLRLEVFMAEYPPTSFNADIDFYLTTTSGEPVTDADITITWDMLVMSHGLLVEEPVHTGGGHYYASFKFIMYGPWEFDIVAAVDGTQVAQTAMSIYVWPS